MHKWLCLIILVLGSPAWASIDEPPANDWIDSATGHRVIRLSTEPGTASFYFHQNACTANGDKLVVTTANGLATIDLTTLGSSPPVEESIVQMRASGPVVGAKSRQVFYINGNILYATHLDSHETREIAKLPAAYTAPSSLAINADETQLACTSIDPKAKEVVAARPAVKWPGIDPQPSPAGRGEGTRSMVLFTVNIKTGKIKPVFYDTSWLNHAQFSPTDSQQLLFAHEGDWHAVNRIWTIRVDGGGLTLTHPRTMPFEIAGHEFFSFDGSMVYYDLETPRSKEFWLAGVILKSGERIRYPVEREHWSIHYNQSHDGALFCGDGGGPSSVANRTPLPEGKLIVPPVDSAWIYLYTPVPGAVKTILVDGQNVAVGRLRVEKLLDMSQHDYALEPNCSFSPDNKWVIFRSNMQGATHTYAVEIKKTQ